MKSVCVGRGGLLTAALALSVLSLVACSPATPAEVEALMARCVAHGTEPRIHTGSLSGVSVYCRKKYGDEYAIWDAARMPEPPK